MGGRLEAASAIPAASDYSAICRGRLARAGRHSGSTVRQTSQGEAIGADISNACRSADGNDSGSRAMPSPVATKAGMLSKERAPRPDLGVNSSRPQDLQDHGFETRDLVFHNGDPTLLFKSRRRTLAWLASVC